MRAAQELADADADLVARNRRRQQLPPAGADGLRHRHGGGKDDRRRVEHRAVVHVVLLGHVRGRRVGHGSEVGAGPCASGDHFARARCGHVAAGRGLRPHGHGEARDAFHRARPMAGHCGTEPVHQQVLGIAHDGLGNGVEAQLGSKGGELGGVGGHQGVLMNEVGTNPAWNCHIMLHFCESSQPDQIAPAARSAAMAASLWPSSRRMASVCWPTAGTRSMR